MSRIFQQLIDKTMNFLDRVILKNHKFAIVSNNCWGFQLYKILNRQYNTPFVGLYILFDEYLLLTENIKKYLTVKITEKNFITTHENFPVAKIYDVRIFFMHYKDQQEAISKWNNRRKRLLIFLKEYGEGRIIYKFCDKDSENSSDLDKLTRINKKRKIIFTRNDKKLLGKDGKLFNGDVLFKKRYKYYIRYLKIFSHTR